MVFAIICKVMERLSLREKKRVRTKVNLGLLFMKEVRKRGFAGINIKSLCEKAGISEATFFNYFPRKTDLLCYGARLFTLKIAWRVREMRKKTGLSGQFIAVCSEIFKMVKLRVFYEITSVMISERLFPRELLPLSPAEKIRAFPRCRGIERIREDSLEGLFLTMAENAIESGEISGRAKARDVAMSLFSIFMGVPLSSDFESGGKLGRLYKKQVSLLLSGLKQ